MQTLWQDLRYGARMLIKQPVFTLVASLTLALGIGANAAIFSVVNAVLLQPLRFPDAERLMTIWEDHRERGGPEREWTSPVGVRDWREQAQSFEHVAAWQRWQPTLTGIDEPERLIGAAFSYDTFDLFGTRMGQGRSFRPEESQRGAERVVVLSHSLWQRRFGGRPDIVGQQIALMGEPHTVIGVLPAEFQFPLIPQAEIFRTLEPILSPGCQRGCITTRVVAKLKAGVTEAAARAELETIASRIAQQFPETNDKVGVTLVPLHEFLIGNTRKPLLALLAAVLLVLLIACVNVANLLLARATVRVKELAIRASLGAGRGRIARQLLSESLLLALLGGGAGLLLGYWLVDLLKTFSPVGTPRVEEIALDQRVLAFTCVLALLTGVLFGLAPIWQMLRTDLNQAMKDSGKGTQGAPGGRRALSALVVVETALALMLLAGAGLLMKSFINLRNVDPGFNPRNLLTFVINLPRTVYPDAPQINGFSQQLLERLTAVPGVQSAGLTSSLPLTPFNSDVSFIIEGRPAPPPGQEPVAWYSQVSPDYFRTAGLQLRAGRVFSERDVPDAPKVVAITEAMAKRYFPNENPLGKRIGSTGDPVEWREIVGVIADTKHFGLGQEARPSFFLPLAQASSRQQFVVLRTQGDPLSVAAAARNVVSSLDRNLPVANVSAMEQIVADSISDRRFTLLLFGLFAALALSLAAAGIYGVMSYAVAQRTHELGIRMALGAQVRDVLRLVIGAGLRLVLLGIGLGVVGALAVSQLLASLLFEVKATDPLTFVLIAGLLLLVALLACYLPARRATKVDPLVALRYE